MPDSWYRGSLAKSIFEGHPYFINLKQGYLYEYGSLHHDVHHPPFIPAVMAIFFFFFGPKIVFANLISCVSAGLLFLPLVRFSREWTRTPLVGYFIYFFVVFLEKADFLFETLYGLSIPTTMLFIFSFLYFYLLAWRHDEKVYPILSGLFLALAALTRYDAQGASLLIMAWHGLLLGFFWIKKDKTAISKIIWMGATYLLVMSPWWIRNFIIFKNPFFSFAAPMIWMENVLEYWDYHEQMPLPSSKVYFHDHTIFDFVYKIFRGAKNVYELIGADMLSFPRWLYLYIISLVFLLLINLRKRAELLFVFTIIVLTAGYLGPLSLILYLDSRYMIPLILLITFVTFTALHTFLSLIEARLRADKKPLSLTVLVNEKKRIGSPSIPVVNLLATLILSLVLYNTQKDFWTHSFKNYLRHQYNDEDERLASDPTIIQLKALLTKNDVLLGPFEGTQRLHFATGLTMIEAPVNLKLLDEPYQFFKKYQINYSMVDLRGILPKKYIQSVQQVGTTTVFQIDLQADPDQDQLATSKSIDLTSDPALQESIWKGKKEKVIFIDPLHGEIDPDFKVLLRTWGYTPISPQAGIQQNREKLFRSGLLMMSYKTGGGELTSDEIGTVKRFIEAGGSVFLLCPVWVWTSYDHLPAERNPYQQISKFYNLRLAEESESDGLYFTQNVISPSRVQLLEWGSFSRIISENPSSIPLIEDRDKNSFGMAAVAGKSKIILFGHNSLTHADLYKKNGDLAPYTVRLIDWLLSER